MPPGRPRKDRPASSDAEAARAGLAEEMPRPSKSKARPQVSPPVTDGLSPLLTPEEITGAGLMVQDGFKLLAQTRGPHWNLIPDDQIDRVGRPTALILRKYGPMAERYPELSLALILAPGVIGAMKVELDAARAKQRERVAQARAAGTGVVTPLDRRERRDPGAEGVRQNDDGTVIIGAPIPVGGD